MATGKKNRTWVAGAIVAGRLKAGTTYRPTITTNQHATRIPNTRRRLSRGAARRAAIRDSINSW